MKKIIATTLLISITSIFLIGFSQFVGVEQVHAQAATSTAGAASTGSNFGPPTCTPFTKDSFVISCFAAVTYYVVFTPTAFLLGMAGLLFDISLDYSINKIGIYLGDGATGVMAAWETLRDLCNLIFIGVLIYTAVITILGKGEYKKTLVNIIIAALLINFSMFFTKVAIDASNILSLQFYNNIATNYPVSVTIANFTNPTAILRGPSDSVVYGFETSGTDQQNATIKTIKQSTGSTLVTYTTNLLLSSLMNLVTAFVFVAGAILFIIRLVILIILVILSPLYFVGSVLPQIEKQVGGKWFSTLTDQLLFAPAFMLMIWISIKTLSGIVAATDVNTPVVTIIINFAITIAFMLSSLLVAKQLGAKGADFATQKAGNLTVGMAAWAGRNTIGRGANALANSDFVKNTSSRFPMVGKGIKSTLEKASGASFDARNKLNDIGFSTGKSGGQGGYVKEVEARVKSEEKFGKFIADGDKTGVRTERYATGLKTGVGGLISRVYMGKKNAQEVSEKTQKVWDKKNSKDLKKQAENFAVEKRNILEGPGMIEYQKIKKQADEKEREVNQTKRELIGMGGQGASSEQLKEIKNKLDRLQKEVEEKNAEAQKFVGKDNENSSFARNLKRLEYMEGIDKRAQKGESESAKEDFYKYINDNAPKSDGGDDKKKDGGEEKKKEEGK